MDRRNQHWVAGVLVGLQDLGVAFEEDGLGLEEEHDSDWVWAHGDTRVLGAEELVRFVHCLKHGLRGKEVCQVRKVM